MVEQTKPSVVLVHAYFGFDTIFNIRDYLAQLSDSGAVVIEDLTHSLFLTSCRTCSNFCVGSLRKWNGISDGAFLTVCSGEFQIETPSTENIKYLEYRREAQKLKREYASAPDISVKEKYRSLFTASEAYLDGQTEIYSMSYEIRKSIMGIDYELLKQRRKANYDYLLNTLSGIRQVSIPETLFGQSNAPLYFAMYVDGRTALQKYMAERNIYLPVIWPMPPQVSEKCSSDVKYIYSHILAVPCDQRYGIADMERISDSIRSYFSKGT